MKICINAVAFYDGGRWVAQGLEHDIAVSTNSIDELLPAFEKAVMANICVNMELGRPGLEGISPAPEYFRAMFDGAKNYIGQIEEDEKSRFYVPALRLVQLEA